MAQAGFGRTQTRYEAPGEAGDADPYKAADLLLTKNIADIVQRHYANHPWMIEVSHAQGVVMISIPLFMGPRKYVVHLATLKNDPMMASVLRGCGEILERYNIPRQKFSEGHFLTALSGIPKHKRARAGVIPD